MTRQECARYLNLDPKNDASWPVTLLDKLISLREKDEAKFHRAVFTLMQPPPKPETTTCSTDYERGFVAGWQQAWLIARAAGVWRMP